MPRQESTTDVKAWVDEETRHIDVVASWESLCDTYDSLRFADPLSDSERLEEYKWIVQQMNSFLSKMRTKLLSCRDKEAMVEMLGMSFTPTGKMELSARRALVYQKLRQQWVRTEIMRLQAMMDQEQETKEEQDGWQY
jgi:hypothetical protein